MRPYCKNTCNRAALVHFFIFELIFTNTVPVKAPISKLKHDKVHNDVVRFS